MKLRELAHSRTGDKGDYSVISVISFKPESYEKIKKELTVELVRERFREICKGSVTRYEMPKIHALIFELEHALGGGVTRSLALDAHGKSLCYIMLDTELSDG